MTAKEPIRYKVACSCSWQQSVLASWFAGGPRGDQRQGRTRGGNFLAAEMQKQTRFVKRPKTWCLHDHDTPFEA